MKSNLWGAKALAVSILLSVSTPVLAKDKMSCREVQKELFLIATAAVRATSEVSGNIENMLMGYERAASQGNRMAYVTDLRSKVSQVDNIVAYSKDELRVYLSDYKECFSSLKASDILEVSQKLNSN